MGKLKGIIKIAFYFGIIFSFSGLILALLAPILEYYRIPAARWLYAYLRLSCHQIPSRCLWILGSNTGLCARCIGIYSGFLVTSVALKNLPDSRPSPIIKRLMPLVVVILVPLIVDGTIQVLTTYTSDNLLRTVTGLLFGIGLGIVFVAIEGRFQNETS